MKKKLALIIPKMYGGGAEKVAADLSRYLPDKRYDKYVIVYDTNNAVYKFQGKVIDVKTPVTNNPIKKIYYTLKRLIFINKFKKKKEIDVTISLLSNPNLVNILSRKNDMIIISVRNYITKSSTGFYEKIHKFIMKLIYNKADLIVAVSEAIKNDLIDNYGIKEEKVTIINNFYDIDHIDTLASQSISDNTKLLFENDPVIITAGRLSRQKGQWHLIRAFKQVKEEITNAKLIILGQGGLYGYLQKLTNDLGLKNDVIFLGFNKNPFKYIAKSDIYVFPSLYEGFPNSLCEAMVCGLPVISSDCKSGPREILNPNMNIDAPTIDNVTYAEYGVLVPPCDGKLYNAQDPLTTEERLLAEAIIQLLESKDTLIHYGQLSRHRVNEYNVDKIISTWERKIRLLDKT